MKPWILYFILFFTSFYSSGQHEPDEQADDTIRYTRIKDALQNGNFKVHGRNFFMSTFNDGSLTDYYANGAGAGIHYTSKSFYGFSMGLGGFFIFNLFSSDLGKRDPLSNSLNRYEIGLFDIESPYNKSDLDRLEEIYLSYSDKKIKAMLGRLELVTPYINPQDGRMRPTVEEGVWLGVKPHKSAQFNAGWLWAMSPRSTVRFFSVENSIGIYPQGVTTDGKPAQYAENQQSNGIGLAQLIWKPGNKIDVQLFDQYVDNIFNTGMVQIEYKPVERIAPVLGIQYHFQSRINNGGNDNPELAYYQNQKQAQVLSVRAGAKIKNHIITGNYTRITKDGRFLMPREWGRDAFYTFMPRERNEGYGDVNAFNLQYVSNWFRKDLSSGFGYGYYKLPEVNNYRLNKYGMPSYHHINLDVRYKFNKALEGLQVQFLIATKLNAGNTYDQPRFVFNKVNMTNINLVLNYTFQNKLQNSQTHSR